MGWPDRVNMNRDAFNELVRDLWPLHKVESRKEYDQSDQDIRRAYDPRWYVWRHGYRRGSG